MTCVDGLRPSALVPTEFQRSVQAIFAKRGAEGQVLLARSHDYGHRGHWGRGQLRAIRDRVVQILESLA